MRSHIIYAVIAAAVLGCDKPSEEAPVSEAEAPAAVPAPTGPDAQMAAVLQELGALGGKPTETLSAVEARQQPTPADAVKALLTKLGKPTTPEPVAKVQDRTIPGPGGAIPIRIYTPAGTGPLPVVLYIHGGGWVIADLDVYDSSARAVANAAGAIVISTHYRQGPEHKFPAAHDDVDAAYAWVLKNAAALNGNPAKVAVMGESAGGNLAISVSRSAKQKGLQLPVHQVLVYPIANYAVDSPSYQENAAAKPLNKPMMEWFFQNYLRGPADGEDPRISPVRATDLAGLPATTIITAQIDPLRSESEELGRKLQAAGVPVEHTHFDGVAHEFFGMGAAVDKAKEAVAKVGARLKEAFSQ